MQMLVFCPFGVHARILFVHCSVCLRVYLCQEWAEASDCVCVPHMCVGICVYVDLCISGHLCVYLGICVCLCVICVCLCIYLYVCVCVYLCVSVSEFACVSVCLCTHTHTHNPGLCCGCVSGVCICVPMLQGPSERRGRGPEPSRLLRGQLSSRGKSTAEDCPGDGWLVANSSCKKDPRCLWSQDETILWN